MANVVHITACLIVPVAWGAAVHLLFHAWHERQLRRRAAMFAQTTVEVEAEEQDLP